MQRFLSIGVLLQIATGITVGALIVIFAAFATIALERKQRAEHVLATVDVSQDLFAALPSLRQERTTVNFALLTDAPVDAAVEKNIAAYRMRAVAALDAALTKLPHLKGAPQPIDKIRKSRDAVGKMRKEVDRLLHLTKAERPDGFAALWVRTNGELVDDLSALGSALAGDISSDDAYIAGLMKIKQAGWSMLTDAGLDRLFVGEALVSQAQLNQAARRFRDVLPGRVEGKWQVIKEEIDLPDTPKKLKDLAAIAEKNYFTDVVAARQTITEHLQNGEAAPMSRNEWLEKSALGLDALLLIPQTALDITKEYAERQYTMAEWYFLIAVMAVVVSTGVGLANATYVIMGVVRPIGEITKTMRSVAGGDLFGDIPFETRGDEIGYLARSLRIFRDNALESERLRTAKAVAEEADYAKSEFLASMSHELRTPLNAILGFSDVIANGVMGPISERYRGYGADILKSGQHLLALVNDVLDLAKLESGKFKLHEEEVDIAKALDACYAMVAGLTEEAGVKLRIQTGSGLHAVWADPLRIKQIVINLLSNAIKFTERGGQIFTSAERDANGDIVIQVRDTGIGMQPEDIKRACEPFAQIESHLQRKRSGTGLGLPLVKHLAELHGGSLSIASQPNVGTTVTVRLPAARAKREALVS